MRHHQLRKIVGFFVLLCSFTIRAQLSNGSFETNCGANGLVVNGCPTFTNGCIPGWFTTHGTPQLLTSGAYDGTSAVQMWTAQGQGEGIGVNIGTALVPGRAYSLCFAYRVNNPDPIFALLYVRATSGLSHVAATDCGGLPPASTFQNIGVINVTTSSGWLTTTLTFTADAAFTQFNLFPYAVGVQTKGPATVAVDAFQLSGHCANTLLIDKTSSSVSGDFEQWGVIRAGSHVNGSTTTANVTVDQSGLTTFAAAQYVSLEDNFLAIPGASDEAFLATIQDCSSLCRMLSQRKSEDILSFPTDTDWDMMNGKQAISVFPNPATDKCKINFPKNMEGKELTVEVMDLNGRLLYSQKEISKQDTEIDLSKFETGMYFIHISGEGINHNQKLIKQ